MALPSSGALRLKQIGTEFSTSPTLKSNYGSGGAPSSGEISIKDFYGRSASYTHVIETSGTIYTETDSSTGEIFVNAAVAYDSASIGFSWAGAGYDGSYYFAVMGVTASYMNNNYSSLTWYIIPWTSTTVSAYWYDYTYPSLGYSIVYFYNTDASLVYTQMGQGYHPTYSFNS